MQRILSAPGKLFLSGEYAVLWGGVARLGAIGPRASAVIRQREDREIRILLAEGSLSGTTTPLGAQWHSSPSPSFAFAAKAIDVALRAHARECLGFELALSPSEKAPNGMKLGMGTSARATLLAVEATRFALEGTFDALKASLYAHWSAQGNRGSGGDVAASFAGGICRYRRFPVEPIYIGARADRFPAAIAEAPAVELEKLGETKLPLLYVFGGQSASTPMLVKDVESRLSPDARANFVEASDALGQDFENALLGNDLAALREVTEALSALLQTLGPLQTAGLATVLRLARSHGAAAKISGAGGGDGCVVICANEEASTALSEIFTARGHWVLPLTLEAGMRGEPEAPPSMAHWFSAADTA